MPCVREICPTLDMITDRIATVPSVHLRDAVFKTRTLQTPSRELHMGWVSGTIINPDDAPIGEGTLIQFRPSARTDFFSAVTGDTCFSSRFVSIIGADIHAFALNR